VYVEIFKVSDSLAADIAQYWAEMEEKETDGVVQQSLSLIRSACLRRLMLLTLQFLSMTELCHKKQQRPLTLLMSLLNCMRMFRQCLNLQERNN